MPQFSERPGIQEETAALNFVLQRSAAGCDGVLNGSLDAGRGNSVNRLAGQILGAVKQNIVNRTTAAKLLAQEAKDITSAAG